MIEPPLTPMERAWFEGVRSRLRASGLRPSPGFVPEVGDPAWDTHPLIVSVFGPKDEEPEDPTSEAFALIDAALLEVP